ncbi:glycine-rich domain-containing protein [Rhizobium rhizogenes]|uniref:glycine-rich domain-containing protein n=1 Tax=Rhizobium rhizogenes TaxID=359 RepID=UPI000AB85FFA|nr:hypothetical protein [Rhizobium rhizogenes]NTI80468.1 hypothetical protein [Rhizobium rhizogenes]NTJ22654.1 hypothetical protein [Rhizobium rhizogenes]QUE81358.1 hypothetical protein EML492_06000 [Rhizobium rhizogenes]TQO80547.1 hypothetical protein FFE80_05440 [Rhizobium rhizogenes]TRB52506.1 hypothetical protein EXN69_22940 [Rhizobium rhizogenes]
MKISDIPSKFPIPFGDAAGGGFIRTIPEASQIGIIDGAASLTDGFPPLNFLPVGSGGVPPFGQDMNGILNQITQWSQWQGAGGLAVYDSAFSTDIGGYPKGAILASAVAPGVIWMSTADDNTTNPDGLTPANWVAITNRATASTVYSTAGVFTFTVPGNVYNLYATCVGGGAGSAGQGQRSDGSCKAGGGGGAGGTSSGWISVTPGQSITITVGVGGTGGAASANSPSSNGANGAAGGTSSVGAFMSATGGTGGFGTDCSGGPGGTGIGGQIIQIGGAGTDGSGATDVNSYGGIGGSSSQGGGGRAATISSPIQNGAAPGSGGSTTYFTGWASNKKGGDGAPGQIILQY